MRRTDFAGKRLLMDADSIGHFCKGGLLGYLKYLFKGQLYILDDVEEELTARPTDLHRTEVLQAIQGGVLTRMELPQEPAILTEYSTLCRLHCAGQAACLAVGRFVKSSIVITNLPCLFRYCQRWGIAVLDTVGLLSVIYNENVLNDSELTEFVHKVRSRGGRITDVSLRQLPIVI